jgi:hypothetical protein
MYSIVLKTWHQETPEIEYDEVYHNLEFKTVYSAYKYLSDNMEEILEWFPVVSISIKRKKLINENS